jgi:hypothetical protein
MSHDSGSKFSPFPPSYRASGLLLHVTALPSPYGIAYAFYAIAAAISFPFVGSCAGDKRQDPGTNEGGQLRARSRLVSL